jgi:hypothetical protein
MTVGWPWQPYRNVILSEGRRGPSRRICANLRAAAKRHPPTHVETTKTQRHEGHTKTTVPPEKTQRRRDAEMATDPGKNAKTQRRQDAKW